MALLNEQHEAMNKKEMFISEKERLRETAKGPDRRNESGRKRLRHKESKKGERERQEEAIENEIEREEGERVRVIRGWD